MRRLCQQDTAHCCCELQMVTAVALLVSTLLTVSPSPKTPRCKKVNQTSGRAMQGKTVEGKADRERLPDTVAQSHKARRRTGRLMDDGPTARQTNRTTDQQPANQPARWVDGWTRTEINTTLIGDPCPLNWIVLLKGGRLRCDFLCIDNI